MHSIDLAIVAAYLLSALVIGVAVTKQASTSADEYFLAGRSLPWWLAGTSMVATTFAADTPLAVTGLVATGGIAGNWIWWAVGIAHVLAAVVFARYWRRLRIVTDAEIMEVRYSGRTAAVLRAVKAAYAAVFINCLTMGWVILAMRKVSLRLFPETDPLAVTFGLMALAVFYSMLGGMRSVVLTDLVQFLLAMGGALMLAVYAVGEFGGLGGLVEQLRATYPDTGESLLAFVPAGDLPGLPVTLFAALLTVGWWRYAEGGGYIMQRLGACRTARDAERAGLLFAILHNAVRPWPWILVGLAALVVWPLSAGPCGDGCVLPYECVDAVCVVADREATYALMMVRHLPPGLLGLMVASILAAFMSTIDTHTNWGASYVVTDVWRRFVRPDASPAQEVLVGRIAALGMGGVAALASLGMDDIAAVWVFIITLGSGLGSVSIARWLWWRVNAQAELASLLVSTALACGMVLLGSQQLFGLDNPLYLFDVPKATRIVVVALGSLVVWVPVALLTSQPVDQLRAFYELARPAGAWGGVGAASGANRGVGLRIAAGMVAVFGSLFGVGGLLLRPGVAWALLAVAGVGAFLWLMVAAEPEEAEKT